MNATQTCARGLHLTNWQQGPRRSEWYAGESTMGSGMLGEGQHNTCLHSSEKEWTRAVPAHPQAVPHLTGPILPSELAASRAVFVGASIVACKHSTDVKETCMCVGVGATVNTIS